MNTKKNLFVQKIKQILSLLLVVSMIIGYAPITLKVYAESVPDRYSILILDTSGSMAGEPLEAEKKAAIKFCSSLLKAPGNNYIAIISLNSSSEVKQEFTLDPLVLESTINSLRSSGGTNITAALEEARKLLSGIQDSSSDVKKNVILCSDGLPESGAASSTGPYKSTDYSGYRYANATYHEAMKLHDICSLYTLGFFHNLSSSKLPFARRFMHDIQNGGYTEVDNPDDLIFEFGNIAGEIAGAIEFYFASGEERDFTSVCYYNDDYFELDPTEYHKHLATMSLCLAMSGFGSNDAMKQNEDDGKSNLYENRDANVRDLLTKIGFGGEEIASGLAGRVNGDVIASNELYNVKPQSDSIGVAFGHKKIKDAVVIAVVLRGAGYESEWAGNFTLGSTGQHYGFNKAKEQVLDSLDQYLTDQNITGKVKLWIVGYSRGAATANLAAGDLINRKHVLNNVTFEKKDLFAYCFETPQGTITSREPQSSIYKGIWNVINRNDVVTKVAMSDLEFRRYGQDYVLPSQSTDKQYWTKKDKMEEQYYQIASVEDKYIVDNFEKKVIELRYILPGGEDFIQTDKENSYQSIFLDEFISKIAIERFKSRKNYVNEFQNGIRLIFTAMYGTLFPDEPIGRIKEAMNIFLNKLTDINILGEIALGALNIGGRNLEEVVNDILTASLNEAGLNNFSPTAVKEFSIILADLIAKFAITHPELTITAVANSSSIAAAHYPELCYAWLRSQDSHYTDNAITSSGDGGYRVVRINCPVDVEVMNQEGEIVGAIYDDVSQDIGEDSIITMFNERGEKLVYLPNTEEYQIIITATDDGSLSYGLSEYSTSAGTFIKNINYINIAIRKGEVYQASIPASNEINPVKATNLNYTLVGPDANFIEPTSVLNDDEVASAYYTVTVVSEDTTKGLAIGNETYLYGSYTIAEAVPLGGYLFDGWYEENELISKDSSYRFLVDKDIALIARFSSTDGSNDNDDANNGNNDNGNADNGNAGNGNAGSGNADSGNADNSSADSGNAGAWICDFQGWWYRYDNGTWPFNQWGHLLHNGKTEWYYFKSDGYMATGWLEYQGRKYYLNPISDGTQGRMMTGWTNIEGKWCYFNEQSDGTKGALLTSSWIDGYWVDENGIWDGLPTK